MTADRDPQVTALLDVLEVAPPRAGFWVELEERLRTEPSPAVELHRVPGARSARRDLAARRRRVLIGVAAAVAVVAAVAGTLALRDDGRERGETVPATTPDGPPPSPEQTTAATYADAPAAALEAADLWIRSIADGDIDSSWELLGAQSRDQLGSVDGFAEVVSDTAERFAPFADTPDRTELVLALGEDAWLVHLTVDSEADEVVPATLIVRTPEASEASIEAFLPGPALGLISVPSAGDQMVLPGGVVPLAIDADATYLVVLDGLPDPGDAAEDGAPSRLLRDDDGAITGLRLAEDIADGLHTVAVAVRFPDGTFAVDSRVFEVGTLEG